MTNKETTPKLAPRKVSPCDRRFKGLVTTIIFRTVPSLPNYYRRTLILASLLCWIVPREPGRKRPFVWALWKMPKPKVLDSHIFCGHCKEFLVKSTFYTHKRRFYKNGRWQLAEASDSSTANRHLNTTPISSSEFDFADDEPFNFDDDFSELSQPKHQGKLTLWI